MLIPLYQTYQMSIEELIVADEILKLNPTHPVVMKHLANFYQREGMPSDEIDIRQKIKRLFPDDYQNLKRLADIFDDNGDLWEAARVYEQIRLYYPKNLNDMRRLAAIYDDLGETFRQLQVLDHIAKYGGPRGWMQKRATKRLRQQNELFDTLQLSSAFQQQKTEELEVDSILSQAEYMHIPLRSSFDFGVKVEHSRLHHTGKGVLDGAMNINSGTLSLQGVKYWHGQDYQLGMSLGVLWDDITGNLYPRDPLSGIGENDFPFLRDPTFDSYGGLMTVGQIQFLAQPGCHSSYEAAYEHGQVEDLDARLRMYYFDKLLFGYAYDTDDDFTLRCQIDESEISDGNQRFHSSASVDYTLWGKNAMFDYRGERQGFIQYPPCPFVRAGYTIEYFTDQDISNFYWSYDNEIQYQGRLSSQIRLLRQGLDHHIMLGLHLAYSAGDSLDYRQEAGIRMFYVHSVTGNEIGIAYHIEKENIDTVSRNLRIIGETDVSTISIYGKWRF